MRQHYNTKHGLNTRKVVHSFTSFEEFQQWKKQEEMDTDTNYVQRTSSRVKLGSRVYYYYCNRSGQYTTKRNGKRCLMSQGTSKIGNYCTATITARQEANGHVSVVFNSTHTNHAIQLAHLPIPTSVRLQIASKLHQGVKMDEILNFIRDSVVDKMERKHLISKQDVHNIHRQFNIEGIKRHKNDLISVQAWVQECLFWNTILLLFSNNKDKSKVLQWMT